MKTLDDIVGLNIGRTHVSVVEAKARRGTINVQAIGVAEMPIGALGDREVVNPGLIADAVANAWNAARPRNRRAVVAVPTAAVEVLTMERSATLSPQALGESVRSAMRTSVGFNADEGEINHVVAGRLSPDLIRVLGVAAPHAYLKPMVAAIESTNIEVVGLEAAFCSSPRALAQGRDGEQVVIVDVGATTSTVTAASQGLPHRTTTIKGGGVSFTQALTVAGRSLSEAERVKRDRASLKEVIDRGADDGMTLRAQLDELVEKISEAYAAIVEGDAPVRVVLIGGGARMPGFQDFLGQALAQPIETPAPVDYLDPHSNGDFDVMTAAYGAAIRAIRHDQAASTGRRGSAVNLRLPGRARQKAAA